MSRPPRTLLAVAAVALAAVAARAAAFHGLELYADEAYYWLWAQRPAAGYFDHPPLVAWLVAAGTRLAPGELGVRILFLVCGGLTVVFAALLARELTDDPRAPLRAALLAAAAPLLNVVGAMALPDAPVAAAYTAALWLLARARGSRWAWVGVAVGVALLAKYTAALLAPALVLLALWDAELRRELRSPWPWLGAAVAVAIFSPCLAWNARHGWVSIAFQLRHGFGGSGDLKTFAEYVAGQLLAAGPLALAAGALLLVRARTSGEKRVAAAALLPLALTTFSAMRGKVEANWPALAYPAVAAAAAAWTARARPWVGRAVVAASVAATAAALLLFAVEQRSPWLLAGTPAVERFHGWREFSARVRAAAEDGCRAIGGPPGCDARDPFVFTSNYQYAGELAYYAGWRRFGPAIERPSQLDVWGELPAPGAAFLFVGGADGVWREFRGRFHAEGEGPIASGEVRGFGAVLRDWSVTPFSRFAGAAPRG